MAMQIAFPREWEEQWVASVRSITQTKTSGRDEREYTKGDLEQIHGVAEATALIRKGKFQEELDSDGDTVFIKSKRYRTEERADSNTCQVHRKTRVDDDEAKKMEDMMDDWWGENQVGLAEGKPAVIKDKDNVKKRPASREVQEENKKDQSEPEEPEEPEEEPPKPPKPTVTEVLDEARLQTRKMAATLGMVASKILTTSPQIPRRQPSVKHC